MNKLRFAIFGLAILVAPRPRPGPESVHRLRLSCRRPAGQLFPDQAGWPGAGRYFRRDSEREGVSVRLVDYYRVLDNQEMSFLNQQLQELRKKETTLSDEMAAKMAWFEFPAPIGPNTGSDVVPSLICTVCGTANAADASVCTKCNAKLEKPRSRHRPPRIRRAKLPSPRRTWASRT